MLADDAPDLALTSTPAALRDCQYHGGDFDLEYGSITDPTVGNCLFERVNCAAVVNDSAATLSLQNNLFWGGVLNFTPMAGTVVVQNNLFDHTSIPTNSGTYTNGFNAFYSGQDRLQPESTNDVVLTNLLVYQAGRLGNYYQPSDSPLINAGSTNASALGLYDYTVMTNIVDGAEIKETNSIVDIGYHYVAVDTNGNPVSTYTNGLPDYLATSSTSTIPDWWEYDYFGNLDQATNADYDGDGTNNLAEYVNGTDPNKIAFSFAFTNQYVATNIVTAAITILAGVPSSMAALVDSTNFSSATWTAYSPTVTVNLGTNQGLHDVWVGLRGRQSFSYQTWQLSTLVLDSTPPSISITNPVTGASFNAVRVNVQGTFSSSALQAVYVNGIVAQTSGTNFTALNVPLDPGTNVVVAAVEDRSGATNTASISVVGATNSDGTMNDPVQLQATPLGGFAPLTVSFSIPTNPPGTVVEVLYDFNGDGIPDLVTNNLLPLTHTYGTNGQYFPGVTVETSAGWFSSVGWTAMPPESGDEPVLITVMPPATNATSQSVTDPVALQWVAPDSLYVLSGGSSGAITEYDTNWSVVRSLSLASFGPNPSGIAVDSSGNAYVAVAGSNQVWKFNPSNTVFIPDPTFGTGGCIGLTNGLPGTNSGQFNAPFGVAVTSDGGQLSVSDSGNDRIEQFGPNGAFVAAFGSAGSGTGQFSDPSGLALDSFGTLYIVDSGNNRITLVQGGLVQGETGTSGSGLGQFSNPLNAAIGERGAYIADPNNNRIQAFMLPDPEYYFTIQPSTIRYALSSGLNGPSAVAPVDDPMYEKFYVADTGNNRVLLYTFPNEDPTPVWGTMVADVEAGDIPDAVACFSVATADEYNQSLLTIGVANAASALAEAGTLTPVYVEADKAEYSFTNTIDGQTATFLVDFTKEGGIWKISEF